MIGSPLHNTLYILPCAYCFCFAYRPPSIHPPSEAVFADPHFLVYKLSHTRLTQRERQPHELWHPHLSHHVSNCRCTQIGHPARKCAFRASDSHLRSRVFSIHHPAPPRNMLSCSPTNYLQKKAMAPSTRTKRIPTHRHSPGLSTRTTIHSCTDTIRTIRSLPPRLSLRPANVTVFSSHPSPHLAK